jgi:hypothetical protein
VRILGQAGFNSLDFYYPLPDYKLPVDVFSDRYLPEAGQISRSIPNYDSDRLRLFDERTVYDGLIENDMFPFFANSFLVACQE